MCVSKSVRLVPLPSKCSDLSPSMMPSSNGAFHDHTGECSSDNPIIARFLRCRWSRVVEVSVSAPGASDALEELTDLLDREPHRGVADVELETLQCGTLRVVGATEHPGPVLTRDVDHPSSYGP